MVSERLDGAGIAFMLTGSFAMAYYSTPRMTRDLDIVVELNVGDTERVMALFEYDFYVDSDDVRVAIESKRMFNLMHSGSGLKVDLILRKDSEYRRVELARRQRVSLGGVDTWIVSREDLILSKLLWSLESASELQKRDVAALMRGPLDQSYFSKWAATLGLSSEVENAIQ